MMNSIRYKTNRSLVGTMDTEAEYTPRFMDYQTCLSWTPNKRWEVGFIGNISQNNYEFIPKNRETRFGTMNDVRTFKVYFDGQERDLFSTLFGALNVTRHIDTHNSISLQASAFHTKEEVAFDIAGEYWLDAETENESLGVSTYMEHARNYLNGHVQTLALKGHHNLLSGHRLAWGADVRREVFNERFTGQIFAKNIENVYLKTLKGAHHG